MAQQLKTCFENILLSPNSQNQVSQHAGSNPCPGDLLVLRVRGTTDANRPRHKRTTMGHHHLKFNRREGRVFLLVS